MAVYIVECGLRSQLVITNTDTVVRLFGAGPNPGPNVVGAYAPPRETLFLECTGSMRFETFDLPEMVSFQLLPAPGLPEVQFLLGLAGIVCAFLVAWAFNRS